MFVDKKKYLLIGPSSSGKSVLLASIISNLENTPEKFWPDYPKDASLTFRWTKSGSKLPTFPIERILNEMAQRASWPEQTIDMSDIRLEGTWTRGKLKKKIIRDFVDIPGEMFADFAGSKGAVGSKIGFADWSDAILGSFPIPEDSESRAAIKKYEEMLKNATLSNTDQIVQTYKSMMKEALLRYRYFISPSTIVTNQAQTAAEYPDNFAPLPHFFRERNSEIKDIFSKEFEIYQKKIVEPLRKQILQADGIIAPVDVAWILQSGMATLLDQTQLLKEFGNYLANLRNWWSIFFGPLVNLIPIGERQGELKNIVICGTKLDIFKEEDRENRLDYLIKTLTNTLRNGAGKAGIKVSHTRVSAILSGSPVKGKPGILRGRIYGKETEISPTALPEEWPDAAWDTKNYTFGTDFDPLMHRNGLVAPKSTNLKILIEKLENLK
jgi:predicted YcjX-like family ATPase